MRIRRKSQKESYPDCGKKVKGYQYPVNPKQTLRIESKNCKMSCRLRINNGTQSDRSAARSKAKKQSVNVKI